MKVCSTTDQAGTLGRPGRTVQHDIPMKNLRVALEDAYLGMDYLIPLDSVC